MRIVGLEEKRKMTHLRAGAKRVHGRHSDSNCHICCYVVYQLGCQVEMLETRAEARREIVGFGTELGGKSSLTFGRWDS